MVKKWGVKKHLYVHFEGLTADSYFGKTRPPEGRSDRKRGFFNTLLMRKKWFLTCPVVFKWSKVVGLKESISLCPFWRFDNWLLFWQNKTTWERSDRNKAFSDTLLMRKHDFWHVQWFLSGQKWGVKKSLSLCPFWRFDNWLFILVHRSPPGAL